MRSISLCEFDMLFIIGFSFIIAYFEEYYNLFMEEWYNGIIAPFLNCCVG